MAKNKRASSTRKRQAAASIVWFDIPADDMERAKKFYGSLFGWTIKPFPGMEDYWHIDTSGADTSLDGGLMARKHPGQPITTYTGVPSVSKAMATVKKLGGKICKSKTAVPKMGYFAICEDTEGNTFALWEMNERAK
jgi:predicted enzyme related to lactoylglutathione lyase